MKDGVKVAICQYCKKEFKGDSKTGTTGLKNHLDKCPARKCQSIDESFEREKQKQVQVEKLVDGKVQVRNFTFDSEVSRKELAHAIVLHEYPLSIVEHVWFRRFVSSLQPLFHIVSRNTIKKDSMSIYDIEKDKMKSLLQLNGSRIAITADMWTSNQKKGYMNMIAHFIDNN
ncbi:hypothetical protein M9H77_23322 [Catharanthus roseus]|uniref:Uncharacterized protein n=1 Tax=Catharanthus roseus TaxID=4058 RepID=A0ACC0ASZ1_CATRO|nr:hypothetical protein M9H77_23322 [Catharanthus roseus]